MADKKMKDAELAALLAEVEQEIGGLLKSEQDRLAKAAPPDGDADDAPPSDEPPAGESPAASSSAPPPPASEGSASSPEASSAAPGESPGGSPAPGDPAADGAAGGDDMAMLEQEYVKLGQEDPEALKGHYMAIIGALQQIMGSAGGSPSPGGPPPGPGGPGGPPPGPSPGGPPPMAAKMELGSVAPSGKVGDGKDHLAAVAPSHAKGEMKQSPGNGGNALAAARESEPKPDPRDVQIAELKKNQDAMLTALDKFLGHPLRKAVTGVAAIGKPGESAPDKPVSRAEAIAKLNEKAKGPLKKSDRERITSFAIGNIGLDEIRDLLA